MRKYMYTKSYIIFLTSLIASDMMNISLIKDTLNEDSFVKGVDEMDSINNNLSSEDLSLKLIRVLGKMSKVLADKLLLNIKEYGVSPTEFAVLEVLYSKGDLPVQKIGEKILITSGTMTYVIDKLEKKKLLKRTASLEDRRVIYSSLTVEGKRLLDDIFPKHKHYINDLLSDLSDEEKVTFIELAKKLGLSIKE